jgi:hypothetical protein
MNTRVEVVFRVVGDFSDATPVTRLFGVTPTEAYGKGDIVGKHPERRHPNGYWGLASSIGDTAGLNDHLQAVLALLETKRGAIEHVQKEGYICDIFCGIFSEDDLEASIVLAPEILLGIGRLHLSLNLHSYTGCAN